jgi:hypothetical protein
MNTVAKPKSKSTSLLIIIKNKKLFIAVCFELPLPFCLFYGLLAGVKNNTIMPVIKNSPSPKIKHLKLNPLSVAKYFWERGIEDMAIAQHLIYFTYLESLKQGYLLFEEE